MPSAPAAVRFKVTAPVVAATFTIVPSTIVPAAAMPLNVTVLAFALPFWNVHVLGRMPWSLNAPSVSVVAALAVLCSSKIGFRL